MSPQREDSFNEPSRRFPASPSLAPPTMWIGAKLVWPAVAAALVVSLGLAQFSWRYFESAMIRMGHRLSNEVLPSRRPVPIEPA